MSRLSRKADLVRAHHDLLDRVVVFAEDDPAAFRRIQANERALRQWYLDHPGWSLLRTRSLARLVRAPAVLHEGQGFDGLQRPLDYACLAWVLWYGEVLAMRGSSAMAGVDQFLMSELAEELHHHVNQTLGSGRLDLNDHGHRQSLVRALRCLERVGALRRYEGSAEEWAQRRQEEVLYEFTDLAPRLAAVVPPEQAVPLSRGDGRPLREPLAGDAPASPTRRAWRALLLGPALFQRDDPEAFTLLRKSRSDFERELSEEFGWELDLQPGYGRILRETAAERADRSLLEFRQGALIHPVLLLCGRFRERVAAREWTIDGEGCVEISEAAFEQELADVRERHREQWGKTLGGLSLPELKERACEEMRRWGMLRGPNAEGRLAVLPVAARYAARYVESVAQARRRRRAEGESDGVRAAEQLRLV